jgi:hypothetical protein
MTENREFQQDKRDAFMALLGTCITEWAWIEEEIYKICQLILGTVSEHTSIVFYRTPTLEGRLSLADELMGTIFPKPENGEHLHFDAGIWSKLLSDLRFQMPIRNQLAHSPTGAGIFGFTDERTGKIDEIVEIKMQSYPHDQEMHRPKKPNRKLLHHEDLETHLNAVRAIYSRLRTFRLDTLPPHVKKVFPQNFAE